MIKSFTHKGLERFFKTGKIGSINPQWVKRIRAILALLNISTQPADMDQPGWGLHPLTGTRRGFWAVKVNKNWRIIFRFDDEEPCDVDLIDYH